MATTSATSEESSSPDIYKDFLKTVLGGSPDEIEERDQKLLGIESEIFVIPEAEKEDSGRSSDGEEDKEKNNETVCFAMDDSDDDADDDDDESEDWDLEDAYNFDPERVAELLQRGNVTEEELVETMQVGMAEAMIQRLAQEDPEAEAARPDCQGDLTGRMTPPAQPTDFEANTPPDPKELADKLEKAPAGRARRSSMVRRGALDEAARCAAKNHRKSIAGIQKSKLVDDDSNKDGILQAVANTRKRNRLSICKAVETLEAAGLGDEPDRKAVSQKLEMVQKCLLEARKKHRDTVAKVAMETVSRGEPDASQDTKDSKAADEKGKASTSTTTDEKPKFQMSASAKAFNPNQQSIEEKIRSAVKAAHQRAKQERGEVAAPPRGHDQWGNPYAAWGSGYDQTGYGYAQAYHPGYQTHAYNQCYDPSWNNQMGYAQGQQWQQPQQAWTQGGAGQNCWVTAEGANAAYGGDCYNYYGGNYSGYGQHQVPIQQAAYSGQAHWQNAAWGAA